MSKRCSDCIFWGDRVDNQKKELVDNKVDNKMSDIALAGMMGMSLLSSKNKGMKTVGETILGNVANNMIRQQYGLDGKTKEMCTIRKRATCNWDYCRNFKEIEDINKEGEA